MPLPKIESRKPTSSSDDHFWPCIGVFLAFFAGLLGCFGFHLLGVLGLSMVCFPDFFRVLMVIIEFVAHFWCAY